MEDGSEHHLFDDPEHNRQAWYPLMKAQRRVSDQFNQQNQQPLDATLADVKLKMGFVTELSKDFLLLFNSFKERLAPLNGNHNPILS